MNTPPRPRVRRSRTVATPALIACLALMLLGITACSGQSADNANQPPSTFPSTTITPWPRPLDEIMREDVGFGPFTPGNPPDVMPAPVLLLHEDTGDVSASAKWFFPASDVNPSDPVWRPVNVTQLPGATMSKVGPTSQDVIFGLPSGNRMFTVPADQAFIATGSPETLRIIDSDGMIWAIPADIARTRRQPLWQS